MSFKRRRAIRKMQRRDKERQKRAITSAHPKPSAAQAAKAIADHRAKLKAEKDAADAKERAARSQVRIDPGLSWFIVQTYPGHEERVEARIIKDRDRFDRPMKPIGRVYRPIEIVQRTRRQKVYTTSRHVMPRHMFVGLNPLHDPRRVLADVQGFYDVLRINGRDVEIPAAELQRFANEITEDTEEMRGLGTHILVQGDEVKILRGTYALFKGKVVKPERGGAVVVEITVLGKVVPLTLGTDEIVLDEALAA